MASNSNVETRRKQDKCTALVRINGIYTSDQLISSGNVSFHLIAQVLFYVFYSRLLFDKYFKILTIKS